MSSELTLNNPATIKAYFEKVQQLAQTGEAFPVDLDEVWPLVYSRKDKAVRTLRKEFVEDEDFIVSPMLGENPNGGRPERLYRLSTSCLEYFIARKVREVFEVYRTVFHQTVASLQAPATPSTETLLLQLAQQQAQLLTNQQHQLEQLRTDVQQLQAGGRPARYRQSLPGVRSAPNQTSRNPQLRAQINQQVNAYCERFTAQQSETYRYLYNRMQTVYGLNVYMLTRRSGESLLDAVERYGYLDRLYSLIMAELAYSD